MTRRRKASRRQATRSNRSVGRGRGTAGSRRRRTRLGLGGGSEDGSPGDPRRRLLLVFVLSLLAGLAGATPLARHVAAWTDNEVGVLDRMAIQGNHRLSFGEIAAATGVERGTTLANIDAREVAESLARQAWIREADVLPLPPSTLLVRVEERRPRALLVPREPRRAGPAARLVDAGGHLFVAELDDESLPRLVGGESLGSDQEHPVLREALALFEELSAPELANLRGPDGQLTVYLPVQEASEGWILRGAADVLLGRRDLSQRIRRLGHLLGSNEVVAALASEGLLIDLRFADQAVLRPAETRKGGPGLRS